jgi:ribosomal protein S3AE
MARACNALEAMFKSNYNKLSEWEVTFIEVKLADPANEALVAKYETKSQTVVIVKTKRGKQTHADVSAITREYLRTQDYSAFEKALVAKIEEIRKNMFLI